MTVSADKVVVSCGATNSALLLLKSANDRHRKGLANSSDMLGRNYMVHNNTALTAVAPLKINPTVFQKTMAINDFYFGDAAFPWPMGNLQLLGKLQAGMLSAAKPYIPKAILGAMAKRSVDWWVMSEDLPDFNNRVSLGSDGRVQVQWQPTNRVAHRELIRRAKTMMHDAGYALVFSETLGIETNSHQCGTARFGNDPATSVLDPYCKTHDIDNLYVMDSSFFPSSTAMNPALTICAQALRVGDHLLGKPPLATEYKIMNWVIGIDLGGSKTALGLVSPENAIVSRRRIDTQAEEGVDTVIERIAAQVNTLKGDLPTGEKNSRHWHLHTGPGRSCVRRSAHPGQPARHLQHALWPQTAGAPRFARSAGS